MPVPSKYCHRGNHNICFDERCGCPECHFTCTRCKKTVKVLQDGDICATCYRAEAKTRPKPQTLCDDCGNPGAFRNPRQRKNIYRCTMCWAKSGESVALAGGTQGLVVACASKPLTDNAHQFLKVRGNRLRCQNCHQDVFLGKDGYKATQLNVVGVARGG